ncbi:hypothetical protein RHSIM_Rhsim07G0016800 [Rhododendron simsii]|uniref:Uncharacterized protein n=1 Tax=Rhododendron simsii TaxID=118357 RepID=A0A834GP31_RHOSS|nr:hypothetical protein RHSIM_Rhsim07G0016800 [Rhododendron simsii]
MSKKNDLGRRKRLHEFELKREKEEKEKKAKRLQAKRNKMKIEGERVFWVFQVQQREAVAGPGGVTGAVVDEESLVVRGVIAMMEEVFVNETRVDGNDKKNKKMKGASGFQVGKRKLKTKLTALAKAKAAQAMEVDK